MWDHVLGTLPGSFTLTVLYLGKAPVGGGAGRQEIDVETARWKRADERIGAIISMGRPMRREKLPYMVLG